MADVSIRDLRNHGGEVVDRAARGETITITRAGKRVAELRALNRPPLAAAALLQRWRRVPPIDGRRMREQIDELLDQAV
jgi:antitoxin (DNA-binding transcriptional repressor) of toxin-antitoxin stability system